MSLLRMKSLEMNNSLQTRITEKLRQEHETLQQYPLTDVCYMLFKNFQYSETTCTGLRLTKLGFTLLKEQYDMYANQVQELGARLTDLQTQNRQLKAQYKETKDRNTKAQIVAQSKPIVQEFKKLKKEKCQTLKLTDMN